MPRFVFPRGAENPRSRPRDAAAATAGAEMDAGGDAPARVVTLADCLSRTRALVQLFVAGVSVRLPLAAGIRVRLHQGKD